jgi:hypothetical protein
MMHEANLRDFFLDRITARELARDLEGSTSQPVPNVTKHHIVDMDEQFEITPQMAIKLCDAVLAGALTATDLKNIGFAIIASDRFDFDGGTVLGEVLHDWAAPEINYPLTAENIEKFKRWLEGSEPYPEK